MKFDNFIIDKLVKEENCFYRRYSDDIVIIFNDEAQFEKWDTELRNLISLAPFYLKINADKTIISKFTKTDNIITCVTKPENAKEFMTGIPFRYLGFDFDGNNVLIKNASLSNYYREMKRALRAKGNRVKRAKKLNEQNPMKEPKETKLYLTNLIKRFTHLGKKKEKSNFLSYADRAALIMYPTLESKENPIRKQVKRSWSIFNKTAFKYR